MLNVINKTYQIGKKRKPDDWTKEYWEIYFYLICLFFRVEFSTLLI